jgi:TIR domain
VVSDVLLSLDALPAQAGELDAFISYARRPGVLEFVDRLTADLQARGKRVWVDRASIEPGADWRARIARGIEAASALVFVISPEFVRSPERVAEIDAALRAHKRIVPVMW